MHKQCPHGAEKFFPKNNGFPRAHPFAGSERAPQDGASSPQWGILSPTFVAGRHEAPRREHSEATHIGVALEYNHG